MSETPEKTSSTRPSTLVEPSAEWANTWSTAVAALPVSENLWMTASATTFF